jgi:hypothetical protein
MVGLEFNEGEGNEIKQTNPPSYGVTNSISSDPSARRISAFFGVIVVSGCVSYLGRVMPSVKEELL